MEHEELSGWLRLSRTPGVGNTCARRLLSTFGLPQQIFAQSAAALSQVATAKQTEALGTLPTDVSALLAKTWDWLQADAECRRVIVLGDPAYPQSH